LGETAAKYHLATSSLPGRSFSWNNGRGNTFRHPFGRAVAPMIRVNHVGVYHRQHGIGQSLFDAPAQCACAAFRRKTQGPLTLWKQTIDVRPIRSSALLLNRA
jgi:hypothetical protein